MIIFRDVILEIFSENGQKCIFFHIFSKDVPFKFGTDLKVTEFYEENVTRLGKTCKLLILREKISTIS